MHIRAMTQHVTRLAQWMADNGHTEESVAAKLNITRSQLNKLKNAVSRPSFGTATALEEVTGIPAGELFRRLDAAA